VTAVVFARTRHVYASYTDYWRLVEAAGYPTCFIDEIDLSKPAVFVVSPWNGETRPALAGARARAGAARRGKVVWWNLELDAPPGDDPESLYAECAAEFDEVWVPARSLANRPKTRHVVLGGHPDFGTPCRGKVWDVCTLAYLWGRRAVAVERMTAHNLVIAPEAFGRHAQDQHVATSRVMVNMLQHATTPVMAPLRAAVAASYNLPLVTEQVVDPWPLVEGRDYLAGALGRLPELAAQVAGDPDLAARLALGLRSRLLLEHPFHVGVDRAAAQTLGIAA
jgi:hypothetical protein